MDAVNVTEHNMDSVCFVVVFTDFLLEVVIVVIAVVQHT